jgi:hypothetical protein
MMSPEQSGANVELVEKQLNKPYRVLMRGYPLARWFTATREEKEEVLRPHLRVVLAAWESLGATVVASMCDDVLTVGTPCDGRPAYYLLFDVDSLDIVVSMLHAVRQPVDGVALDSIMTWDARIGRPFYAREEKSSAGD